ncbi:MAG: carboxypeptidase-like regulatory domain-containing protein [Terriglobales bacterium]
MRTVCLMTGLALGLMVLPPRATAQVSGTAIHGVVRDPSGASIPGATLMLKDAATALVRQTTTGVNGAFAFSALQAGTYTLTATATGFQQASFAAVVVNTGLVTDVPVQLKVGAASQTVEVKAALAQLETSTNEVATTIDNKDIDNLPYASRDSLSFALLMAGSQSGSGGSDFDNLPNASLNITLDGMNNNSQRFKSGGTSFYAFAPERINSTEEVTVSTAGQGADLSGGAMSIRFTTKRGTDQYHVQAGWQFGNWALNANSFFNNLRGQPISHSRQNNPYIGVGGPLLPFSDKWRHKLFFYGYFESQPQPSSGIESTTVLSKDAQAGNFTYVGTDGTTRTVNLLTAAATGGISNTTPDPTIAGMLNDINKSESGASGFLPITGQPYWQTMEWVQPSSTKQYFPTARLDYHITPNLSLHSSWNLRYENIEGSAPPYPGETQYDFGNAYKITTYVSSTGLDWTISPNLVNSAMFGIQSNGEYFYHGADPQQWAPWGNRSLYTPLISTTIPNPYTANVLPFIRNNPVHQVRDDLTWTRGSHTIQLGGSLMHTSFWETSFGSAGVPVYDLSMANGDPAATALAAALPDVNTNNGDLNNAESLFSLLTGRVAGIGGNVNVDEKTLNYAEFQPQTQRWAFTTSSLYLQDSYRMTPNFTVNYGLNWEFDAPIKSTNGINGQPGPGSFYGPSTGLFQPGTLGGNLDPSYVAVRSPYKGDYVNPAPNLGLAWNPSGKSGLWHRWLGDHKTVLRAGYAINYYNEGMNTISNTITNNTGSTQSLASYPGNPGFTLGGLNLTSPAPPLSAFPTSFGFPFPQSEFALNGGQSLGYVNPDLKTPYTQSWNLGIQRELPGRLVLEVRYMGNKSTHMWHYQNMDEVNIFENGFLPQFQQAQANLNANIAGGNGNTFANKGLPGQGATPIFDAAFGASGSNAALSNSSGYGNRTFVTDLQQGQAGRLASSLASTSSASPGYFCRMAGSNFAPCSAYGFTDPGAYPMNFFVPNPYATSLYYQDDNGDNNYNSLQVDARKVLGHGLAYDANFVWSHSLGDIGNSNDQTATYQWYTNRSTRLNYGPSPFDHRFAWNSFWTYDLPIGRNKALNIANPLLDRALGGWTLGGTEQIASGSPTLLNSGRDTFNNLAQSGVVLGSGLTIQQLQSDLSSIPDQSVVVSGRALMSNVSSIALSSGAANPVDYAPASTPGAFSQFVYLRSNTSFTLNMSLNKAIQIRDRLHINLRMDALNFLNHPYFALGSTTVTGNTFGQVTSASGTRTILLRASLDW